jgi:hypothetical protein
LASREVGKVAQLIDLKVYITTLRTLTPNFSATWLAVAPDL